MAQDIFISYAKEDKTAADTICTTLEDSGLQCWIAPRNIAVGEYYASAIILAIDHAKIVVVVFSRNSDQSAHVRTEIERAFNQGKIIIPFRIENIEPSDEIQYFIGSRQWLDAFSGPLDDHIHRLIDIIDRNFGVGSGFDHIPVKKIPPHGNQTEPVRKIDFSGEIEQDKLRYLIMRSVSYGIDYAIGFVFALLFTILVTGISGNEVTNTATRVQWILILMGIIIWFTIIDSSWFRSPGKYLLGLTIVWPPDNVNSQKWKMIRSLVKNFPLLVLLFLAFFIDGNGALYIYAILCVIWFIPIIFTPNSQSIHDRVAGTSVFLKEHQKIIEV